MDRTTLEKLSQHRKKISSAVAHDVYNYRGTFFPCPCLQRYCKYNNHEVVLSSIGFKNTTGYLTRPSVLRTMNDIFKALHNKITPC